jgi:hypothetical protein
VQPSGSGNHGASGRGTRCPRSSVRSIAASVRLECIVVKRRTLNAISPTALSVDEMLDKATKAERTGTWAETSLIIMQTERGRANGLPLVLQEGEEALAFAFDEGRIYGHESSITAGCDGTNPLRRSGLIWSDLVWYTVIVVAPCGRIGGMVEQLRTGCPTLRLGFA